MSENRKFVILLCSAAVLALLIRWPAAYYAYPTPGDASHFVQHAVELAGGDRSALSDYWSQGMILFGAAGIRVGLNPHLVMQGLSVVSGVMVVIFLMLLARELFGGIRTAVLAGFLCATLPVLAHYSAIAFSEMTFMMCALGGIWFAVKGLGSMSRASFIHFPLSACFFAAAFYFKGADAFVTMAALGLYALLFRRDGLRAQWKSLMVAAVLLVVCIAPLYAITYANTGHIQAGSKISNLAIGRDWNDSKAVYGVGHPWRIRLAYLREHGTVPFMWHYRAEIAKRVILNAADAFRLLNDLLFEKTFRMGAGWFFVFVVLIAGMVYARGDPRAYVLPLLCIAVPMAAMSLFFYHGRMLVPLLPHVILLIAVALAHVSQSLAGRRSTWMFGALLAAIFTVNAVHASGVLLKETVWWNETNQAAIARELKKYGGDELIIMTYGPLIAVHHYTNHPLRTKEILYTSIEELEAHAERSRVDLLVVSDIKRPHWPVADVFKGADYLHPNWRILEEVVYPSDDWRIPTERWLIIGRGAYLDRRAAPDVTTP